jgi:hypothetical protein
MIAGAHSSQSSKTAIRAVLASRFRQIPRQFEARRTRLLPSIHVPELASWQVHANGSGVLTTESRGSSLSKSGETLLPAASPRIRVGVRVGEKKGAASIENPPPRLGCSRQLGLEPHGGVHNGRNTTVSWQHRHKLEDGADSGFRGAQYPAYRTLSTGIDSRRSG